MGSCCVKPIKPKKKTPTDHTQTPRRSFLKHPFIQLTQSPLSQTYQLLQKLGEGSFGTVKLALHKPSSTTRAIKIIPLSVDLNTIHLMNEVNILKNLDHPNIIKIFEVIQDGKTLNIVMEHCSGGELFEKIKKSKGFSENQAAQYMLDIVSAVKYCHQARIVHRDLKPENLLFEDDKLYSRLKVIDFGTSQSFTAREKLKNFTGTTYYMAPEVISGSYDEKCDVWSLGVILYIMLSGFPPFYSKTENETFEKIQKNPVTFKGAAWTQISEEAKVLIQKMLRKDPTTRYSIHDVYSDPWLQNRAHNRVPDKPLAVQALKNLVAFTAENHLQKVTMNYVLTQLVTSNEIEELKKLFESLDKNGDGRLSKEEIELGCQEFLQNSEFNPSLLMQNCDLDGNGFVAYSDFLRAAVDWEKTLSTNRLLQAFKQFDSDNSGKISRDELLVLLKNAGMPEKDLDELLRIADKNQDGEIDFEEFQALMQKNRV